MSARIRLAIAVALITLIGLPALALTLAQPPSANQPLQLPDLPDIETRTKLSEQAANPKTQQRIRQALDGGGATETGDPVLDDVLQIIKRRGSVLDGSQLESAEIELGMGKQAADATPKKAHAAECLLKAARMLEKIEPADKTRRELLNQMRREAVRLLTQ